MMLKCLKLMEFRRLRHNLPHKHYTLICPEHLHYAPFSTPVSAEQQPNVQETTYIGLKSPPECQACQICAHDVLDQSVQTCVMVECMQLVHRYNVIKPPPYRSLIDAWYLQQQCRAGCVTIESDSTLGLHN